MTVRCAELWHCSSHFSIEHWSVKTIWTSWFAYSAKSNVTMLFDDFKVVIETWIHKHSSIRCLLADYHSIRTPIKETRPSFSDVLLDNHEEDKIATQVSNEIRPSKWQCRTDILQRDAHFHFEYKHYEFIVVDNNSDCTKKVVLQQLSSTQQSVETTTKTDQSLISVRPTSQLCKIFTTPLTVCLFILLILQLLALSIYLVIHFNRQASAQQSNQTFQRGNLITRCPIAKASIPCKSPRCLYFEAW